jgi:hypothetical protein
MVKETPEDLEPEVRQRIYKLPRLGVRFSPDWLLEIQGIFAEVQKNPRIVSRPANLLHLAYKGCVNPHELEGTRDDVR